MRILLTGAGGFVGGSVICQAPTSWEIHAVVREKPSSVVNRVFWHLLDLRCRDAVDLLLERVKPDVIIHAAAAADIDWCEKNPSEARETNTESTRYLTKYAKESGSRFIFLSTDNVFDGARGQYVEADVVNPVNYYGRTKVWAEHAIRESNCFYVIARVALVVGLPLLGMGNSAMSRMLATLKEGRVLGVPDYEIRSPIDVITLGKAIIDLVTSSYQGVLHLAGNDSLGRYEMMKKVAYRFGFDENLVVRNDPRGLPGRAERPVNVSLDNTLARSILSIPLLGFDDAISLVIANAGKYSFLTA